MNNRVLEKQTVVQGLEGKTRIWIVTKQMVSLSLPWCSLPRTHHCPKGKHKPCHTESGPEKPSVAGLRREDGAFLTCRGRWGMPFSSPPSHSLGSLFSRRFQWEQWQRLTLGLARANRGRDMVPRGQSLLFILFLISWAWQLQGYEVGKATKAQKRNSRKQECAHPEDGRGSLQERQPCLPLPQNILSWVSS